MQLMNNMREKITEPTAIFVLILTSYPAKNAWLQPFPSFHSLIVD
jgi:hypothetical protein